VLPHAAEKEVGAALEEFAKTRFRLVSQKNFKADRDSGGPTRADFAILRRDVTEAEADALAQSVIERLDAEPLVVIEVKTGRAGLTQAQRRFKSRLMESGRADLYVLYHLPQSQVRPGFIAEQVQAYLARENIKLTADMRHLVEQLSAAIQRGAPDNAPVGSIFGLALQVSAAALGLALATDDA